MNRSCYLRGLLLLLVCSHLAAFRQFCVISIPKSGLNLTGQILFHATGKRQKTVSDRHDLMYFPPAEQFVQLAGSTVLFSIAHAFYTDELYEALVAADVGIIFVERDPRDVVVSFARWMKRAQKWGDITMADIAVERLILDFIVRPSKWLSLPGQKHHEKINQIATSIKTFYEAYSGWKQRENVFVLRYETLVGDNEEGSLGKREAVLRELFEFIELTIDERKIKRIVENIDSMKVHTFTSGQKIGRWKNYFSEYDLEAFESIGGNLLLDQLGYSH